MEPDRAICHCDTQFTEAESVSNCVKNEVFGEDNEESFVDKPLKTCQ